jgi:hypothetical protein
MPYRQLAQEVLAQWRQAERALDDVPNDSREAARLRLEIAALRDRYQRIVDEARQANVDELPALPTES